MQFYYIDYIYCPFIVWNSICAMRFKICAYVDDLRVHAKLNRKLIRDGRFFVRALIKGRRLIEALK